MSAQDPTDEFTTLCVRRSTKDRLNSLKPFDSMSWDEFTRELADNYEKEE